MTDFVTGRSASVTPVLATESAASHGYGASVPRTAVVTAKFLVIHDDGVELRALCDSLREEGFTTSCHDKPARALIALREEPFDIMLTDLRMPEVDGITLLRQAREIDPDLGVIVLTGYATVPTAVESMQLGAVDYVKKPVTLAALLPAVQRCLQLRAITREKRALEARDRVRTVQLEAVNRDLELFGARVAHDLREPVNIVRGFARLLSVCRPRRRLN